MIQNKDVVHMQHIRTYSVLNIVYIVGCYE